MAQPTVAMLDVFYRKSETGTVDAATVLQISRSLFMFPDGYGFFVLGM
jgi:hypothetical protein